MKEKVSIYTFPYEPNHMTYKSIMMVSLLSVFTSVADTYDKMNDAMSLGVHRCWKDWFVSELRPRNRTKMLDMAGGTGDIAFRALLEAERLYGSQKVDFDITVADINADMLRVGEQRAIEDSKINQSRNRHIFFIYH